MWLDLLTVQGICFLPESLVVASNCDTINLGKRRFWSLGFKTIIQLVTNISVGVRGGISTTRSPAFKLTSVIVLQWKHECQWLSGELFLFLFEYFSYNADMHCWISKNAVWKYYIYKMAQEHMLPGLNLSQDERFYL